MVSEQKLSLIKNNLARLSTPFQIFLLSRGIILLAMLAVAPLLPEPPGGLQASFSLDVFNAWDTKFYETIATQGYVFTPNDLNADLAFFPLFPLLIRGLMGLGMTFNLAGFIVANTAFLGTLCLLYIWVKEEYSAQIARWSTLVCAFFPLSLFGTVIYTESLFLLCSTGALYFFQKDKYIISGIFGALSTATRVTGLALIPTFLITSWRKKKPLQSYLTSLISTFGILLYSLYCLIEHNSAIAFLEVQKKWQPENFVWGRGWLKMLGQFLFGHANMKAEGFQDPVYPIILLILFGLIYSGWKFRARINSKAQVAGVFLGILTLWIFGGDAFINLTTVFGSIFLLWKYRDSILLSPALYSVFSFIVIFSSGRTTSAERYVYGIITSSICLGLFLNSKPRFAYTVLTFFGILLFLFSIRFAQSLWVA